jgi:membrane-associated phospholipid phosphatase
MAIFVIFLMLLSLQVPLHSQVVETPNSDDNKESKTPFIKDWLADELKIWTSPFKINKKSFLFWGGIAMTTAYLIKKDTVHYNDIHRFTLKNQWVKKSSSFITQLGSDPFNLGLIGSLYLGGVLLKNDRARETARLTLKSLLHSIVVSWTLKRVFRRQRPYVENGVDRWFNHGMGSDYRSFPSGHTTTAWSVATVIAGMYKDKPVVPVICYSLATLVGLSRISENKHWASDVLVGAVLGYSIGRFVLRKYNKWLNVTPLLSSERLGVSVSYEF